jgi:ubiquinone/menaquinone biosynthesis C-methylase UbiE
MNDTVDEFTRLEHEGWQRVAGKYDSVWSSLTRQFIGPLLAAARVSPGIRLLDIACGPGHVAAAAEQLGATAIGIDFSAAMVRNAAQLHPSIDFREDDAQQLAFADSSFDRVVANFGLLHMLYPQKACSEARRVLRSGGWFAFTVWACPEENPGARIVNDAVETYADMSVPLPQGPPYYLYTSQSECRRVLQEAGFEERSLTFDTITIDWRIPSPEFLFEAERDAGVRTAALLSLQTPERLENIRLAIVRGVRNHAKGDLFAIPMAAHVVAIRKK